MRPYPSLAAALLTISAALLPAPVPASPVPWGSPTIAGEAVWSGEIVLRGNVVVAPGAVLRVRPGTVVLVEPGKGVGITVLGRLLVEGDEKGPVRFAPETPGEARDAWEGIRLVEGDAGGHLLSGFRVERAREGVSLTGTSARMSGGVFSACAVGIQGNQKSSFAADNCVFDGNNVGAAVSLGGRGTFSGCRFDNILKFGLVADKGAEFKAASCAFSRGKTGIYSLTNAPCRVEESSFSSLETGIVARQMGKESAVSRCAFENNGDAVVAVQFCHIEVADSLFRGNRTALDVREFSGPVIRHNRFEANQAAVNLFRKSHARVEKNVFFHNRNAVVVNYSSYPLISGNVFDRNDMSVRLEKFQSGDWEEREGSPEITAGEAARRGSRNMPAGVRKTAFPKRVNAKGNYWGPDADRDPAAGTLGKVWDGKKFGPVRYDGFEGEYMIDVVDVSGEEKSPVKDAGPRGEGPASGGSRSPSGVAPAAAERYKETPEAR